MQSVKRNRCYGFDIGGTVEQFCLEVESANPGFSSNPKVVVMLLVESRDSGFFQEFWANIRVVNLGNVILRAGVVVKPSVE